MTRRIGWRSLLCALRAANAQRLIQKPPLLESRVEGRAGHQRLHSGFAEPSGWFWRVLEIVVRGALFDVIASQGLLEELLASLQKPKLRARFAPLEPHRAISAINHAAELHPDPPNLASATRDKNDDFLVALAISSQADALVSLDDDLLVLRVLRHSSGTVIPVIRPGELLALLRDAGTR